MSASQGTAARSISGRQFAYLGVAVGLVVSVAANVAHAAGEDKASIWSLGMAGFWPVGLFVALEILTRTTWQPGKAVLFARGGVGVVAAVAASVSYWHLHSLLLDGGEAELLAWIGPLGIDGLMAAGASSLLAGQMTPLATPSAATLGDTGSDTLASPLTNTRQAILDHLSGQGDGTPVAATVAELVTVTGKTRTAVSGHLDKLVASGQVRKGQDRRYRVAVRRAS